MEDVGCATPRLGLQPGYRLGIWNPGEREWVELNMAAMLLGIFKEEQKQSRKGRLIEAVAQLRSRQVLSRMAKNGPKKRGNALK